MTEPITLGQKKAFETAFQDHPRYSDILAKARTLTKAQAHAIIEVFYGSSYKASQNKYNGDEAKKKITKALSMLDIEKECSYCHKPLSLCKTC